MYCTVKNEAMRKYRQGILVTMTSYIIVIFGVVSHIHRDHPNGLKGPEAYVLAILPAIPIVCMLAVVGMYLRAEKDEFLRWMTIQALLWATAVMLALSTVVGFLQNFAQVDPPPMYLLFVGYWIVFAVAQGILQWRNSQVSDDEPA